MLDSLLGVWYNTFALVFQETEARVTICSPWKLEVVIPEGAVHPVVDV